MRAGGVSDKLPALKPRELIRALEKLGWRLDRTRGSHHILVHPVLRKAVPVPAHNRDLSVAAKAVPYCHDQGDHLVPRAIASNPSQ